MSLKRELRDKKHPEIGPGGRFNGGRSWRGRGPNPVTCSPESPRFQACSDQGFSYFARVTCSAGVRPARLVCDPTW